MTTKHHDATAPARPPQTPARERDDACEPDDACERDDACEPDDAPDLPARPLTAAQLAAPSTRRWRRAGRFATSAG